MKTTAAILRTSGLDRPYTRSRPLTIEEIDLEEPGPGEVRVKIGATGLCHSDLSVIDGTRPRPLPMILGHEAAGVIDAVGPGVVHLQPGDHVVFSFVPMCGHCLHCLSGRPALCEPGARSNTAGTLLSGARRFRSREGEWLYHHLGVSGFSEYTIAAAESCVRIAPHIPLVTGALFGCALTTGVGAVLNTARAEPGYAAVVFGLGGVGLSVIMGAALAGCHPIVGVDLSDTKLDIARGLGASHVVKAGERAAEEIRAITSGGAHYAFEAVGSAAILAEAYAVTRRGGKTVAIGLPHPKQILQIPAVSIVGEERQVIGSYMGSAAPQRDIPRLLTLYEAGKLPVERLHSRSINLVELNEAFDAFAEGEVVRQIVTFAI